MMQLERMTEFVAGLNRHGAGTIGDGILQLWTHGRSSARYIRASANFILGYTLGGERHIFRANHITERSAEDYQAEVECLEHLALKGLSVPRPLRSKSGSKVETATTELGDYVSISYKALGGSIV